MTGANPLSGTGLRPPRTERGGWLRRSGYVRTLRVATVMTFGPMLAFLFFMISARLDGATDRGPMQSAATVVLMFSVPVAVGGYFVRARVHCKVCGLNLPSCVEARVAGSRRWEWIANLEGCPICGDDGSASAESHARWRDEGRPPEEPYWNPTRVAVAIAAIVMVLAGLSLL